MTDEGRQRRDRGNGAKNAGSRPLSSKSKARLGGTRRALKGGTVLQSQYVDDFRRGRKGHAMKPQKHQREVIASVRQASGSDVHLLPGGKHPRVYFQYGGREYRFTVAGSPSSSLTIHKWKAWLHRTLRQEGAQ
jgi:hypothetical protein